MKQVYSERYSDDLLHEAVEMARSGATRGMILSNLKQRGVAADVAGSVADRALKQTTFKNRQRGLLKLLGGISLMAIGGGLLVVRGGRSRVGIIFFVFGLIIGGSGFIDMITGTDQKSELV